METQNQRKGNIDITFFVPCYNEEDNVIKTINTILAAVGETKLNYQILIIDDHSKDKTVELVKEYMRNNPDVHIELKVNQINHGLGYNYIEGAFLGKGKYYMPVFGDNAEPKETILAIIKELGTADIIIPYFGANDSRQLFRKILSRIFVNVVNFISGCSLKYYNGPVLHLRYNVMRWHSNTLGFAYQAEIIIQLVSSGVKYKEIQIYNFDRKVGVSKAFAVKNIFSVTHSLLQIFLRRLRKILFKV